MELGAATITEYTCPSIQRICEFRVYPTSSGVSLYIRDIEDRKRKELAHDVSRRRAELLARTTARLLSTDDPQALVEDLCGDVMEHLGCHVFFNYLVDDDDGRLRLNACAGIDEQEARRIGSLDPDVAICGCCAAQGARVVAEDIQHSGDARADLVRSYGVQTYAAHPLLAADRVLGTLSFGARDRTRFTEDELSLMRTVADHVAVAVENARLFASERERARFAGSLAHIDDQLLSSLDRHEMMRRAVAEGARALGADSAAITVHCDQDFLILITHGFPEDLAGTIVPDEKERHSLYALKTRQVLLVEDASSDPRVDAEHMRSFGIGAVIVVPLVVGGEAFADLFFNFAAPRRFSEAEAEFARRLGSTLSLALENARLYEDQQRIATVLQENLIHPLPEVEGLDLAVRSLPADQPELVGGDFSDVFVLDDGRVVIVIGDVAGKGLRAAGMTETVRSTLRAFAAIDSAPAFVLRKTNELLLRHYLDESHVTALLCLLDPRTRRLSLVSAGHPAPIRLSRSSCGSLDIPFGPPLGGFPTDYVPTRADLAEGDCLVLFTDGVIEARRDGEELGDGGLVEIVEHLQGRPADEVAQAVADAALGFSGQLRDDLHVVVVRLA